MKEEFTINICENKTLFIVYKITNHFVFAIILQKTFGSARSI